MWPDRVVALLKTYDFKSDPDWQATNDLRTDVADFRHRNPSTGLPRLLFDRIAEWKLRGQIHRTADHLLDLNDSMIVEVTGAAIRIEHPDLEISSRARAEVLRGLPGVGLGVASAILAMYFPESFGIIDFRVWDEIHERDPALPSIAGTFSIGDYLTYLATIRPFAKEHDVLVQTVDFALWKSWELRRQ